VQTKRGVIGALAEQLSGRVGFEAASVVYSDFQTLEAGGLELVPHNGLVESLRAIKEESELEILRRACAITDRVFERLTGVKFVGRTEREVSWDLTRPLPRGGRRRPRVRVDRRRRTRRERGRTRARATARSARASSW